MGVRDFPIRGAGGGSSGGNTPTESPDSLSSKQYAHIVDLICEGEIEGLVDGLKSIYFDDVPLMAANGSMNFSGVVVDTRNGTQNQDYIPGFSQVESEIAVGIKVAYDTPVTRSITNANINAVRVTLRVPVLIQQEDDGDINGTFVSIAIDVQNNGGGFQTMLSDIIVGKTSSDYHRAYRIELPGSGPWDIRVCRTTPDATNSKTQNEVYFNSFTEIIEAKLRYPNAAIIAVQFDAEQFARIPVRGYHIRGQKDLRIPSNYNPETRSYLGIWDGTFNVGWTDNPAWVFYDICTNDRYGLGDVIDPTQIDKWALYSIAQYCDELVDDGYGGQEPRFTVFLYKQSRQQAFEFLVQLATVFRAISYWSLGQITCVQDRPSDVVAQFTAANVVEGEFSYSGSSGRARHTVALVTWNDPADHYRQAIEAIIDEEGVARYGINETEIVAVGCKSRGQAHRFGKWLLYSERNETETVTFKAGLDAARVYPGAIIQTLDPHRSGRRWGGRLAEATASTLTLDAPVSLEAGKTYAVSVVLPSGAIQSRAVVWVGSADEEVTTLDLATDLDDTPTQWSIWVLAGTDLVPEVWRVVGIEEADPGQVSITALAHDPDKFAFVEDGLILEPKSTTTLRSVPDPVTALMAQTVLRQLNAGGFSTRISVSWVPPESGATSYVIAWRRDDENWKQDTARQPAFDIDDVPVGEYTIKVIAINALGRRSQEVVIQHTVDESDTAPDVQNLELDPAFDGPNCPIKWSPMPAAVQYQVKVFTSDGATLLREQWVTVPAFNYNYGYNVTDGGPHRALRFEVVAHTLLGHSANPATLLAENPAPAVPTGILIEPGPKQIGISAARPADTDLAGMLIWMGPSANVPLDADHLIYRGSDNAYMKTGLAPGVPMYFRLAFFDQFGEIGLTVSTSFTGTPQAAGGILVVQTLPDSPANIGGEISVFLDVDDPDRRGLWGWNPNGGEGGEGAWEFTRDGANLIAHSVTSDKLAVSQLSAISGNLGTMTAGNITLDAAGFIKGGAASFSAGAGFWMGFDSVAGAGYYKFRIGVPGAAGAAWDGQNFKIYGNDGGVAFSSTGGLDGTYIKAASIPNFALGVGSVKSVNIGNGEIKTANIGVAEVDTLRIKGNAVTVPFYASSNNGNLGNFILDTDAFITFVFFMKGTTNGNNRTPVGSFSINGVTKFSANWANDTATICGMYGEYLSAGTYALACSISGISVARVVAIATKR